MIVLINLDNLEISIDSLNNINKELGISSRQLYYLFSGKKLITYNNNILIKLDKKDLHNKRKIRSKSFN